MSNPTEREMIRMRQDAQIDWKTVVSASSTARHLFLCTFLQFLQISTKVRHEQSILNYAVFFKFCLSLCFSYLCCDFPASLRISLSSAIRNKSSLYISVLLPYVRAQHNASYSVPLQRTVSSFSRFGHNQVL